MSKSLHFISTDGPDSTVKRLIKIESDNPSLAHFYFQDMTEFTIRGFTLSGAFAAADQNFSIRIVCSSGTITDNYFRGNIVRNLIKISEASDIVIENNCF